MTIKADIIDRAAWMYGDPQYTGIPEADWVVWTQESLEAIASVKPEAMAQTKNLTLTIDSAKQELVLPDYRLLAVYRNMGTDGSTPGKPITGPVSREDLSQLDPAWHTTANATTEVLQYIYEPEVSERTWWVYPRAPASAIQLEASVATFPADLTSETDTWPLSKRYRPIAVDYLLARAWMRDDEQSPTYVKGVRHLMGFYQQLGVQLSAEFLRNPSMIDLMRPARAMPAQAPISPRG